MRPISFPLVVALATAVYCQSPAFDQVATTDDARQVYVWSSVPLKTVPPSDGRARLYQITSPESITQVAVGPDREPFSNFTTSRTNLHLSGGGQTLLWTQVTRCGCCSICIGYPPAGRARSWMIGPGMPEPQAIEGHVQISHNGRYLLQAGASELSLRAVEPGMTWPVPARSIPGERTVTSDGRVLGRSLTEERQLVLWQPGKSDTVLRLEDTPAEATISDDGSTVIYRTADGRLRLVETGSNRPARDLGTGMDAVLSNDGGAAVFRRENTCFLFRRDGIAAEPLLPAGTGAVACTLAGFGTAAIAITDRGQVLRIDTDRSGAVTELIPPTSSGLPDGSVAPGAVLTWRGQRSPVEVRLNGEPLPLIRDTPGELWFQVPFDLSLYEGPVRLEVPSSSPFGQPATERPVQRRAPYFLGTSGLVAAHDDFHGLITNADPARPGEVVHLWAVGLGRVTGNAKAGEPGPLEPLARLVDPFDCRIREGENVPVLFAGLAPGLRGIYQVDVQVPAGGVDGSIFLRCGTTGAEGERHGGWLPVH